MENAPPIFLLKMKNYFLNCVEEVLCNRVYVGSPCEKEPHPRAPPMRASRQKIVGLTRIDVCREIRFVKL